MLCICAGAVESDDGDSDNGGGPLSRRWVFRSVFKKKVKTQDAGNTQFGQ